MKTTVCLTGASGGIGQTLLKYLLESFHVKALFRKETVASEQWKKQGCQIVLGDLRDKESLMNLVAGSEIVFHCAALINSISGKEAHEINVEGTRRLAQAAAESGCKRFIHLSSIAVYTGANLEGKTYTEKVQLREDPTMELYCLTKLRAEIALMEVAENHELEYVILRPTCVYGPATKSYTITPINLIQKGIPLILGDGEALLDVVYVEDVVRAMLLAAHSPKANGEIFNLGGETLTCKELYSYYGQMLQRPVRDFSRRMANVVASFSKIHREFGKSVKWIFEIHEQSREYPSTKAKELLGYTPQVSLVVGMLKTELWLQANGYIPAKRHLFQSALSLYSFHPRAVVRPTTEEEIVQIIQVAAQQGLKVRAIGAMHSFDPISTTEDVCIVLDRYKNFVNIEGSLVTVQAGMRIKELNEILAKHNLALPSLGALDEQTVSGAISTGTHGGSVHHPSISGYVHRLRIIRADGSVLQVERSQEIFNATVISLGLLGIFSTVTFKCVPAFSLQSESCKLSMEALLERFEDIQQTNKYVDIKYTPIIDSAQVLSINSAVEVVWENEKWHPPVKSRIERWLNTFALKSMLRFFHSYKWNWLQQRVAKSYERKIYSCPAGQSDLVFIHVESKDYDPFPIPNMEIAIPYSQARNAISILRTHFQRTQQYPTMYLHIRCSAQDELWLSPSYRQAICWIDFWQYPYTSKFFQEMVELLKPFNFRCHWGKQILVEREYLKLQYEKWNDFVQLRHEWDPKGMFSNPVLDKFFSSELTELTF
jgi:nucleoside-diphosphate-sugar epimerase